MKPRPSLALAAVLLAACVHRVPLPPAAERYRPKTADGFEISLVRYLPKGPATGRPVLLCHGISANERNMDLDDQHSIARWFAAHGREAWTMSLRGTGQSDRASPEDGRADDYTFDEYWKQDLPTAVHEVQRISGAAAIDYVGHSMGGMVLYAYLAEGGTGIAAAATLGSPTNLAIGTLAGGALGLSGALDLPSSFGAAIVAPFSSTVDDGPIELLLYNRANTPHEVWARLMAYGTADMKGGVVRQLAALGHGDFKSADGKLDFRQDMARIRTPVLVVSAKLDRVAPAPAVKDGYRALGGGPREWLMISQAHGAKAEYGHMDLVLGDRAGDEVWSKVLAFLDRHAR